MSTQEIGQLTPRRTVTVAEAARLLGIGRASAYQAVATGAIPSLRLGRRIVVPIAALERMLSGPGKGERLGQDGGVGHDNHSI